MKSNEMASRIAEALSKVDETVDPIEHITNVEVDGTHITASLVTEDEGTFDFGINVMPARRRNRR